MRTNVSALAGRIFDILVIGGGASGAATAREAALRGFSTALIEKDDFGSGASAHCFKVVHGGIRYLQHADLPRMRASCRERSIFLRIAPHLVSPLPFVIPTYGRGRHSKWFLGAGMRVYDALTADCNRLVQDPARQVAKTRFLGCERTLELFPSIETQGLTGAAVFEDGQMYNPPRLVWAFAAAAAEHGAVIANHVEALHLLIDGSRVGGVAALDRIGGERFDIRARLVINASGPWAEGLRGASGQAAQPRGTYSRDACFAIARKPNARMALAIQGQSKDTDAMLARGARHLFLVPWRDLTLVGVWHRVVPRSPDEVSLPREELRTFIDEINASYPTLQIAESEVCMAGFGLVPFGDQSQQAPGGLSFGKQSRLLDHAAQDGLRGLITLVSVRYTVARMDAVAALDLASKHLGREVSACASQTRALPGGEIEDFNTFAREFACRRIEWLPAAAREPLARNYGAHVERILARATREPALQGFLPQTTLSYAEVAHCVREEMAERMTDVVFRRTELGTGGHPGEAALDALQQFMTRELNWSAERASAERAAVQAHLARYLAAER
jgi:glycerol-3-phosphate dehydrogenase